MTHTTISHPGLRLRVMAAAMAIALGVTVAVLAQQLDDGPAARVRADSLSTTVQAAPDGLSAYAHAHGLTGLSPASLTRVDAAIPASPDVAAIAETYRDVARYAQARGLAGLSPASVAPMTERATAYVRPGTQE